MPLYEYECEQCEHRFELIQRFSDPPAQVCPSCGGPVRKLPSSPAIQFKGSGWYITDYARKGGGAGEAPGSKPAESGKDTTTPSTDKAAGSAAAPTPASSDASSTSASKPESK